MSSFYIFVFDVLALYNSNHCKKHFVVKIKKTWVENQVE